MITEQAQQCFVVRIMLIRRQKKVTTLY